MTAFTTESALRLRCRVEDEALAPDALVQASIDDAHARILAELDPAVDTEAPPENLVQGETLLAGALLISSLASGEAVSARPMTVGGQRVEAGARFASLSALSARLEREAWALLAPYLHAHPGTEPGAATDSAPVLGAE